ncbi:MAG: penicillin-binding transpeptidase domain-containing protein [Verrucomicrobiota bacterium]
MNEFFNISETLGWILIHSLWQGVCVAAGLALLLLVFRNPAARHILAMAGLIIFGIIAVATGAVIWNSQNHQLQFVSPEPEMRWVATDAAGTAFLEEAEAGEVVSSRVVAPNQMLELKPDAPESFSWRHALGVLGGLWVVGAFWMGLRRLFGIRTLRAWKEGATQQLPVEIRNAIQKLEKTMSGISAVPVRISEQVAAPLIYGLIKPTILLPASLVTGLSQREIEMALAHEFAHWKRRDHWWFAIQLALETLYFFHPAVWWMGSVAKQAREEATDDLALRLGTDPVFYARMLARVAASQFDAPPEPSLGAVDHGVAARIRRLMPRKPERKRRMIFSRRETSAAAAATVLAAFWLMNLGSPAAAESDKDKREVTLRGPATRGIIVDREGVVLAGNETRTDLAFDLAVVRMAYEAEHGAAAMMTTFVEREGLRTEVKVPDIGAMFEDACLPDLMRIGLAEDFNREAMHQHYRNSAGLVLFTFAKDLGAGQIRRAEEAEIPGLTLFEIEHRVYPLKGLAPHVTGYTSSSPKITHGEEDFDINVSDPESGKAGLERTLNEQLRGLAGTRIVTLAAADDRTTSDKLTKEPTKGATVTLTIDARIQKLVMDSMKEVSRGSAVVIEPSTGKVLAMVSLPNFDPNQFIPVISAENWEALSQSRSGRLYNRGVYAKTPGSVFKMVTALANAQTGVSKRNFHCAGGVQYGTKYMKCWISAQGGRHGSIGASEALKKSCNCYYYLSSNESGIDALIETAEKLGIGQRTEIGLGEEQSGLMPSPDWLKLQGMLWSDAFTAMTAIGQGYVQVTPLQMASVTATIANGGVSLKPRLIQQVTSADGKELQADNRVVRHDFSDLSDEIAEIQNGMWKVVNESGGTAGRAAVGEFVAGKTGTAQTGRPAEPTDVWFTGYAPFEDPRWAICVFVHHGDSGGKVAAPIARRIFQQLLSGDELPAAEPAEASKTHWKRLMIIE